VRITDIETIRADRHPSMLFVQVHTDAGITGLGETCVGVAAVEAYLHETSAPDLIGSDPRDIARAWNAAHSQFIGFGGSSVAVRATSAVDIALWDILGKVAGLPIYRLLGGPVRDSIRAYNTCAGPGYGTSSSNVNRKRWGLGDEEPVGEYEDLIASVTRPEELVASLRASGVTAMKIWPFDEAALRSGGGWIDRSDLREGVKIIERTRAAAGDDMDIMLEMHSLWSPQAALTIARAVADFDLFWIEDPFRVDSPDALARFADRTPIPLTVGETIGTRFDYHRLLRTGAVSYLMFDVGWTGGISEAVRIASLAQTYGVPVAPHDCTGPVVLTAGSHLCAHLPNAVLQETVRAFYHGWYRDFVTELPKLEAGRITPPDGPGLGVELRPEVRDRPDLRVRTTGLG
jgi:L-alanine-DL-glutamate epimerase-like enolase superfamily enzyme